MRLAVVLAFGSVFFTPPAQAEPSAVDVVNAYVAALKRVDLGQAMQHVAPDAVWVIENSNKGPTSTIGYRLYQLVTNTKIGSIESVECKQVADSEFSCEFRRKGLMYRGFRTLTERYVVKEGKIAKIFNSVPDEVARMAKGG